MTQLEIRAATGRLAHEHRAGSESDATEVLHWTDSPPQAGSPTRTLVIKPNGFHFFFFVALFRKVYFEHQNDMTVNARLLTHWSSQQPFVRE